MFFRAIITLPEYSPSPSFHFPNHERFPLDLSRHFISFRILETLPLLLNTSVTGRIFQVSVWIEAHQVLPNIAWIGNWSSSRPKMLVINPLCPNRYCRWEFLFLFLYRQNDVSSFSDFLRDVAVSFLFRSTRPRHSSPLLRFHRFQFSFSHFVKKHISYAYRNMLQMYVLTKLFLI